MPEEPDLSPDDVEILDEVWRKRIEAKKQERAEKQISSIADQILAVLRSRPEGMQWQEIRQMFANGGPSDEQIKQALLKLMKTPLARNKVEKTEERSGERFLLAAS